MRAALFCSALASVFLIDACGSSCPAKDKLCSGVCSDLTSDSDNCGACGNACGTGFACSDGGCAPSCPAGSTACGSLCTDTDTDQANCGTCGKKCLSGQACTAGACGTACLAGFTVCSGDGGQICANELTDSANCGGCNSACPAGSICNGNGACAGNCASGFSVCGAQAESAYCANFTTDNQNCGACSAPCFSGEACSAGKCATSCAPGFSACDKNDGGVGTCADFLTDSVNCGACGKVCASGQTCTAGTCAETCAAGFNACGGGDGGPPYCANFLNDDANCGGCRQPCTAGQVCSGAGVCAESCAFPYRGCPDAGVLGPYCADVSDDSNNCGMCGKACSPGATCTGSACSETCAAGYNVCTAADGGSQVCADFNTDSYNCGSCGFICPSGKTCSGGNCTESCAFGYSACSGSYCADLTIDVNNCGTCGTSCGSSFKAPGCCNGVCTSLSSGDANHCGTCGISCTAGNTPGCCDAKCVDQFGDSDNCGGCDIVCSSRLCLGGNCCSGACGVDPSSNCLGSCDTTGACNHPTCTAGYGCDTGPTCLTTCASSADCSPDSGYTCWNPPGGSCCLPVATGANLYVDGKLGADTTCCDSITTPCQTITFAMSEIAAAGATGVTLNVAWNADPKVQADWAPANGETYPIHLGYGVTLQAPSIFFTPAATSPSDVFDVYAYDSSDTGTVTIEGSSTQYMFIGFNSTQKNLTGSTIAVNSGVASETAVPLTLSGVWMNGQTEALNLGAGADVSLGPSPVIIGSGASTAKPLALVKSPGSGIYCKGTSASPATLTDLDAGGAGVLEIDQQDTGQPTTSTIADIYAYDYCTITLSQSPVIGVPPPCPSPKVDGEGILDQGGSSVTLTGATIQCMYNHGIDEGETPVGGLSGSPTLSLDSTLIQNTGQTGFKVSSGSASSVTNSTFYHCRFGVVAYTTGSIDLSGGGNIVACNTSKEPGEYNAGGGVVAGINVWNDMSNNGSLNASNVLWDDSPPGYWTCTDTGASASHCTCESGTCMGNNIAIPDDSDAVTADNTNAVPINLSDAGLQSTYTCD